jgi:hypothetical protein
MLSDNRHSEKKSRRMDGESAGLTLPSRYDFRISYSRITKSCQTIALLNLLAA